MTGDHTVGLLLRSKEEQAVGNEGFPRETGRPPRCLRSSLHTPRNPQSTGRVKLDRGGSSIALPPRPTGITPAPPPGLPQLRGSRATERASLHLRCTRADLEPQVRIHGEITNSHYSRGLCVYLEFEEILQKPATQGRRLLVEAKFSQPWAHGGGRCGKPQGPLPALTPAA